MRTSARCSRKHANSTAGVSRNCCPIQWWSSHCFLHRHPEFLIARTRRRSFSQPCAPEPSTPPTGVHTHWTNFHFWQLQSGTDSIWILKTPRSREAPYFYEGSFVQKITLPPGKNFCCARKKPVAKKKRKEVSKRYRYRVVNAQAREQCLPRALGNMVGCWVYLMVHQMLPENGTLD
jgi:hypothetical protein